MGPRKGPRKRKEDQVAGQTFVSNGNGRIVREVRATEGETIEILWRLSNGQTYLQTVKLPPRMCQEARIAQLKASKEG